MDEEQKAFFEKHFNAIMAAHQETKQEVHLLKEAQEKMLVGQRANRVSIQELWKAVGVSKPPPPGSGPSEGLNLLQKDRELSHQVTNSNLDLEALKGTVIVVDSKVGSLKESVDELASTVKEVKDQNSRQLQALGTEQKGLAALIQWMVKEKDGQKFFFSAFAAMTGLVTAIGTTYALLTGRLPMPNTPVPQAIAAPAEHGPPPSP